MQKYLHDNDLLHRNQSGFPREHSTALTKLTYAWLHDGKIIGSVSGHIKGVGHCRP